MAADIAAKTAAAAKSASYASHKERTAKRQNAQAAAGRDIGPIPAVVDPARRGAAARSFRSFCESYFSATYCLAWSPDHLRVIAAIESAVLTGGLFAFAMPRGSGKTSLVESAALWSLLYGHKDFVAIIGSDEEHARTMLESIQIECEVNEELLADFPEVIFPIAALEKIHQRASGQLCEGRPTNIAWTASEVQFPSIPGSVAAGGIIRAAGITGRIRGMSAKRAHDQRKVRPSLVLIDDPQTDESAKSPSQVATREAVMAGAILGLAGPGTKISGLCTLTVVAPGDLADRLLDRTLHPSWQGERTKLVYAWPTAESLWAQYAELRREGQRTGRGTTDADQHYAAHQIEMDLGAVVAWEARKNEDDLTPLQHAWNLRIDRGESAFFAEFQNEPVVADNDTGRMQRRELAKRATSLPRGTVALNCDTVTAFIDVQEKVLFWLVAGWNGSFGGSVIAYGAYPEQGSSFFEAAHARRTLAMAADGAGFEASLTAGLDALTIELLGREWFREDGAALRIGQLMIDANWGQSTQTIRTFCRRSAFAATILPSHGRGIGASMQPLSDKTRGRGDKLGLNWRLGQMSAGQRSVMFDSNFWKSFVASRMRLPIGDPEALSLHEGNHDLLTEHLSAEYPVRTEARGRIVDEWKTQARDNHWLDCLVGAAVAASILGIQPSATESGGRVRRKIAIPKNSGGKIQITRRLK